MPSAWRQARIDMPLAEDMEQETGFTPEPTQESEPQVSERDKRMEEIAARGMQERASQLAPEPLAAPEPDHAQPPAAAEAPAPAEPAVKLLDGDMAGYKVKAKVDGEELEVPLEEVLRQYQKNGAADKRLAEATRLLREAQEVTAKPEPEPAPQIVDDQAEEEFISALYDEPDRSKAKESLRKLLESGRRSPTLDTKKLVEEIAPTIKQQLAVENALEQFREANADIIEDPYLASITERFWAEEIATGKDQVKALKDAGAKTRDWLKSKGVVTSAVAAPTVTRDEKLKRKEGIDNLPTTSARATDTSAESPQTVQDKIAEMRKARGFEA